MNFPRKRNLGLWVLIAALVVTLTVLGVLQYRSTQRMTDATALSLQEALQASVMDFRRGWENELSPLCLEMHPGGRVPSFSAKDVARRLIQWRQNAPHPEIVSAVLLWDGRSGDGSTQRISPTGNAENLPWSDDLKALLEPMKGFDPFGGIVRDQNAQPRGGAPTPDDETPANGPSARPSLTPPRHPPLTRTGHTRTGHGPGPEMNWMVDQERLVLLHPYVAEQGAPPRTNWIIVVLDREFLSLHLFPELTRRYVGRRGQDYEVAVVLDSVTPKVFYSSSRGFGLNPENPVDARLNLFGRPSLGGKIRGSHAGILIPTNEEFDENAPHVFIDPIAASPDAPELLILAQHRQGSVEAAVAGLRKRNLAINFGVLGVLAIMLTLVIVTSQRAKTLAQMQMDFVAGVSHELRTPLTAISLAARNLQDGVVPRDGYARYGKAILNQAVQLAGLVDEILLFSETHSGRHVYKIEPMDVSLGIHTTLETMAPLIESSAFAVEEYIHPDLPLVQADAAAFGQCLQNLISNSLKYGAEKQWIGVKAYAHQYGGKREICVSVQDRGRGISSKDLKQIFEPFYRSQEVASEIHGNGLGLPLTKTMVEAMGGHLTVISEPGRGSTFTIHLRPATGRPEYPVA